MKKNEVKIIASIMISMSLCLAVTGCGYQELPQVNNQDYGFINNDEGNDDDDEVIDDDDEVIDDGDDNEDDGSEDGGEEVIDDGEGDKYALSDQWGFINSGLDSSIGVSGYYIDTADYTKLISQLNDQEKANISYTASYYDDNGNIINTQTYDRDYNNPENYAKSYEEWGGSCFGMSVSTVLKNDGVLSASNLNAGNTLSEADVTSSDVSAINFYHWQQRLLPCRTARNTFESLRAKEQTDRIIALAKSGKPFTLDMFWKDSDGNDSGHTVVGYGIETDGSWTFTRNGQYSHTYDTRILIYDCSYNPDDKTDSEEQHYIYIDSSNGMWCNPAWGIMSSSSAITNLNNDNGEFGGVMSATDYLNAVNYTDGSTSDIYEQNADSATMATLYLNANQPVEIRSTSGKAEVNGLQVKDSTYGNKLNTAADTAGKISTIQAFIPQGEDYYTVTSKQDMNFGLDVGNMFISSSSNSGGTVTFNSDGTYEAKYDSKDADSNITVTSNTEDTFGIDDCNSVKVSAPGSSDIKISQSSSGVVVDSDDLSGLSITGETTGQNIQIDAATSGDSVKISKDATGDNIIAKADTNGDGKYDKTISKTKIPKKTKQKITLKKKTLKIKAGKTAKLKAKAKTKLTYKKTSGNKKITISSGGKIKVNKKLKKGTYKIKVKVTAKASKKYKKATKTFTIKVKIK